MEPTQWLNMAPFGEAGYSNMVIEQVPPGLVMASGWEMPDMGGGVDGSDHKNFGALANIRSFKLESSRIVVTGGDLKLGSFRSVGWDSFQEGKTPWTDGKARWAMSHIWFLRVEPDAGASGEFRIFKPGEPQIDGASAIEVNMSGGHVTARIFKVELGDRVVAEGRRSAIDAGSWPKKLTTEIQMDGVNGKFAVGMDAYSTGFPQWKQDDDSDDGSWWMVAYDKILGIDSAQFGSSIGTIDLRDAPWDPYWA